MKLAIERNENNSAIKCKENKITTKLEKHVESTLEKNPFLIQKN